MALSDKALGLLKQIYAYHRYGDEDLVSEDPDEALEYVLERIVDKLSDRHHNAAPLYMVTDSGVSRLRSDRLQGYTAKTS
ncbi:MAG: hypothetical protein ACREQV_04210 [Candidatus Binatia bacterium]